MQLANGNGYFSKKIRFLSECENTKCFTQPHAAYKTFLINAQSIMPCFNDGSSLETYSRIVR